MSLYSVIDKDFDLIDVSDLKITDTRKKELREISVEGYFFYDLNRFFNRVGDCFMHPDLHEVKYISIDQYGTPSGYYPGKAPSHIYKNWDKNKEKRVYSVKRYIDIQASALKKNEILKNDDEIIYWSKVNACRIRSEIGGKKDGADEGCVIL